MNGSLPVPVLFAEQVKVSRLVGAEGHAPSWSFKWYKDITTCSWKVITEWSSSWMNERIIDVQRVMDSQFHYSNRICFSSVSMKNPFLFFHIPPACCTDYIASRLHTHAHQWAVKNLLITFSVKKKEFRFTAAAELNNKLPATGCLSGNCLLLFESSLLCTCWNHCLVVLLAKCSEEEEKDSLIKMNASPGHLESITFQSRLNTDMVWKGMCCCSPTRLNRSTC